MSFLELKNIGKKYDHRGLLASALKDVSFTLERGQSLAICGPSGAGKSTLLNILGGLDAPSCGQVLLDGTDLNALSENELAGFRRERLGFVFQFHHLLEDFTVLENVMMPLLIQGHDSAPSQKKALEFLDRVGLFGLGERYPQELSGGEQQRAAIARAVVHGPQMILADEPTGNLDETNSARVFELLCGLNHDLSSTLIVVTHQDHFAKKLGGRLNLKDGNVMSLDWG